VNPFQADGLWLRCALHAHTTNSDGELAPEMLVRHYEWAGYDVLAITDHWARTVEPSTKKLLVIPSTELNAYAPTQEHDAHVLALGLEVDPVLPEGNFAPLEEVVAWIAENGGVPYLAHTYWSGLRTEQWWDCPGLLGIEVWNSGCELELGRGDSSIHWDEALEHGRPFFALATDDSHHPGYDSGFAWTWVRAKEKTQEAVLDALRTGHVLRLDRPRDPRHRGQRRRRRRPVQPGGSRHALFRTLARRARERGPARIPEPLGDHRAQRRRVDHRGATVPSP